MDTRGWFRRARGRGMMACPGRCRWCLLMVPGQTPGGRKEMEDGITWDNGLYSVGMQPVIVFPMPCFGTGYGLSGISHLLDRCVW